MFGAIGKELRDRKELTKRVKNHPTHQSIMRNLAWSLGSAKGAMLAGRLQGTAVNEIIRLYKIDNQGYTSALEFAERTGALYEAMERARNHANELEIAKLNA